MVTRAAVKLTPPISDRDHLHGPRVAPVTLVEYGDYECPYCGQAYFVLEALLQSLGNRLLYAFRHFPLATAHPHAQHAAEAAEAAGAQDEFWQMHRSLFYNQDALEDDDLMQYASDIGLDLSQFVRDMTEHRYAARVREDFLGGVRSGVNGTPTLFINGARYDGSIDLESLFNAIEVAAE